MGSESSSYANYNSTEWYSGLSSNSGEIKILEEMDCESSIIKTNIERVWIVKRSISLDDRHVRLVPILDLINHYRRAPPSIIKPLRNIFTIKNSSNWNFKHWAIILELSNNAYVNIQFGKNGFSLKEFYATGFDGENILQAILNTWGEKDDPFSFCYLGYANFDYEKFKNILREKKEEEKKCFKENRKIFYNPIFKNCQDFAKYIEKILFDKIKFFHFFDFYLEDFFKKFFSNKNINEIKFKSEELIQKENKIIINYNLKEIEKFGGRKNLEMFFLIKDEIGF